MEESAQLQFHQKLIEHNQALLEGLPTKLVHKRPPFEINLEPISENREEMELPELELRETPFMVRDSEDNSSGSATKMIAEDLNVSESIPSLDEELATQLWEEVREKLKGKTEEDRPPIASIAQTDNLYKHLDAIQMQAETGKAKQWSQVTILT